MHTPTKKTDTSSNLTGWRKYVNYISRGEWLFLGFVTILFITIPFTVPGAVTLDNWYILVVSIVSGIGTTLAEMLLGKGRKEWIFVEVVAITAIVINTMWLKPLAGLHAQYAMGIFYACYIIPILLATYFFWGKRDKREGTGQEGVVERRHFTWKHWVVAGIAWAGMFTFIYGMIGIQQGLSAGAGIVDAIPTPMMDQMYRVLQSMTIAFLFILLPMVSLAYKEFALVEMFTLASNILLWTTLMVQSIIQQQADSMAIVHLTSLLIDFSLGAYVMMLWYKDKRKHSESKNIFKAKDVPHTNAI